MTKDEADHLPLDETVVVPLTRNPDRKLYPYQQEAIDKIEAMGDEPVVVIGDSVIRLENGFGVSDYAANVNQHGKAMIAHNMGGRRVGLSLQLQVAQVLAQRQADAIRTAVATGVVPEGMPIEFLEASDHQIDAAMHALTHQIDIGAHLDIEPSARYVQQLGRGWRTPVEPGWGELGFSSREPRPRHVDNGTANALAKRRAANKAARKARRK